MSYKEKVEKLCEAALQPGKTIMATKKESRLRTDWDVGRQDRDPVSR